MLINHGLINNLSLLLDSVQVFGMPFLNICSSDLEGVFNKKIIHALLFNLLNSEDTYPSKK